MREKEFENDGNKKRGLYALRPFEHLDVSFDGTHIVVTPGQGCSCLERLVLLNAKVSEGLENVALHGADFRYPS